MCNCFLDGTNPGVLQVCSNETFNATCAFGKTVQITKALYGRMKTSRCLSDKKSIGCEVDVLAKVKTLCSGRQSCVFRVNDTDLVQIKTCRVGNQQSYLEASYNCVSTAPRPSSRPSSSPSSSSTPHSRPGISTTIRPSFASHPTSTTRPKSNSRPRPSPSPRPNQRPSSHSSSHSSSGPSPRPNPRPSLPSSRPNPRPNSHPSTRPNSRPHPPHHQGIFLNFIDCTRVIARLFASIQYRQKERKRGEREKDIH